MYCIHKQLSFTPLVTACVQHHHNRMSMTTRIKHQDVSSCLLACVQTWGDVQGVRRGRQRGRAAHVVRDFQSSVSFFSLVKTLSSKAEITQISWLLYGLSPKTHLFTFLGGQRCLRNTQTRNVAVIFLISIIRQSEILKGSYQLQQLQLRTTKGVCVSVRVWKRENEGPGEWVYNHLCTTSFDLWAPTP